MCSTNVPMSATAAPESSSSNDHRVIPAPAPPEGRVERNPLREPARYFHAELGAAPFIRSYSVRCHETELEIHVGRGLTPETVLAELAARPCPEREYSRDSFFRDDLVVFDARRGELVGFVLNPFGHPDVTAGKPLALRVQVDGNGVSVFAIEANPDPDTTPENPDRPEAESFDLRPADMGA